MNDKKVVQVVEDERDTKIIKSRLFHILFEPPFFSFSQGVVTTITQDDLINIFRQIKNPKLKNQLREFIRVIDEQQNLITDMDNYVLPKTQKESPEKRIITNYKFEKKMD